MKLARLRVLLSFLLSAGLLLAIPFSPQQAQSTKNKQTAATYQRRQAPLVLNAHDDQHTGNFVIVGTAQGSECRPMTAREEQEWRLNEQLVEVHPLTDELPRLTQQTGLTITLRGTSQLEANPQAKQAFQRAADKWKAIIRTNMTVLLDVDYGTTRFGVPYPSANIIGSTSTQTLFAVDSSAYDGVRLSMLDVSNNARQTEVLNNLPVGALPTELGNSAGFSAASANLRALDIIDRVPDEAAERPIFGAPPSIGFNSALTFDFDPSDGIDAGSLDFEAAAVHEIGHALGFITYMGAKELSVTQPILPTPWDIFRFRPGGLVFNSLNSRQRGQLAGGTQVFFVGGEEYALSTGTNAGTNGDGNQGSHWKADEQSSQYVGIMDPTGSRGERSDITSADVLALSYFGYQINSNFQVYELLNVSDNSREETQDRSNAIVVNRFTPPRYPAKLESFRVQIPPSLNGSAQEGQTLRIVGYVDPNRTGQPPTGAPTFERTVTLGTLPPSRILDVVFTAANPGPTLQQGDIYLGIQPTSQTIPVGVDTSSTPQGRSFISTNNGQSFQALQTQNAPTPAAVNFIARALMSMPYSATPVPGALTLSPSTVAPGSPAFKLYVFGSNFQGDSKVNVNGSERPTTYQSGSQLQADLTAADVANAGTLKITVANPVAGGSPVLSPAADLLVAASNPAPTLTRLDPPASATGANTLTLNVYGVNFNANSRIRVNGNERTTAFVNSTQLTTALTQTDLANASSLAITVNNPTPGGGTSNALSFTVTTCNFSTGITGNAQNFFASSTTNLASTTTAINTGFVLNATNAACQWTAASTESWLNFTGPTSGAGKSVISYTVQPQPALPNGTAPRETRLTVGNQTVTVRQMGRAAALSAASFSTTTQFAPNAIVALFGVGIATATETATTTPLPTTLATTQVVVLDSSGAQRAAQLFFVSPSQINLLLPANTATGGASIVVVVNGVAQVEARVTVAAVAPALFTANSNGQGVPSAFVLRRRGTVDTLESVFELNTTTNRYVPKPIDFVNDTDQLFLVLFGTGIRGRSNLSAVQLQVGGTAVAASFAGEVSGFAGLDQINTVELPRSLRGRGEVNLTGSIDSRAINAVTLNFK